MQCLVQAFCLLLRSILSEKGVVRIKYARATFNSPISLAQKHPFQMPLFLCHGKCLYTYSVSVTACVECEQTTSTVQTVLTCFASWTFRVLTLTSHIFPYKGLVLITLLISQEAFIILITPTCFVFRDESDVPVFSLSDQRSVVLEVTVTNMPSDPENPQEDGDDAHATQLLVSLPNTLSYSGLMGQQVYLCLSDSQQSFFSQSYFSLFPNPDCTVCSCLEGIV